MAVVYMMFICLYTGIFGGPVKFSIFLSLFCGIIPIVICLCCCKLKYLNTRYSELVERGDRRQPLVVRMNTSFAASATSGASALAEGYQGAAQIIQGVLIFLSAVVAILGYNVKARHEHRNHIRERKLEAATKTLHELAGPLQALVMAHHQYWCKFVFDFYDDLSPGDIMELCKKVKPEVPPASWWRNEVCWVDSLLGPEGDEMLRSDLNSKKAKAYRRFVRSSVKNYFRPAAALCLKFNSLKLPPAEEFVAKFPGASSAMMLRRQFFLDMINHLHEWEDIIENEWDKGDFETLNPRFAKWPSSMIGYSTNFITQLHEEITRLTDKTDLFMHDKTNSMARAGIKDDKEKPNKKTTKKKEASQAQSSGTQNEDRQSSEYVSA